MIGHVGTILNDTAIVSRYTNAESFGVQRAKDGGNNTCELRRKRPVTADPRLLSGSPGGRSVDYDYED